MLRYDSLGLIGILLSGGGAGGRVRRSESLSRRASETEGVRYRPKIGKCDDYGPCRMKIEEKLRLNVCPHLAQFTSSSLGPIDMDFSA